MDLNDADIFLALVHGNSLCEKETEPQPFDIDTMHTMHEDAVVLKATIPTAIESYNPFLEACID